MSCIDNTISHLIFLFDEKYSIVSITMISFSSFSSHYNTTIIIIITLKFILATQSPFICICFD